jgi:hypothetical protein
VDVQQLIDQAVESADEIWKAAAAESRRLADLEAQRSRLEDNLKKTNPPSLTLSISDQAATALELTRVPTSLLALALFVLSFIPSLFGASSPLGTTLKWPTRALAVLAFAFVGFGSYTLRERSARARQLDELKYTPDVAALQSLTSQVEAASSALREALLEKGILPFLRAFLNDRLDQSYNLLLSAFETPGLSELFDPAYEIPTEAAQRVERLLSQMPGGSVGISGPRGSGKSTLIRSFCAGRYASGDDQLAALVSAPVEYSPREFVLYLFATLCRKVIGPQRSERTLNPDPDFRLFRMRRWLRALQRLLALAMLIVGVALLLPKFFRYQDRATVQTTGLGVGMFIAGLALVVSAIGVRLRDWREMRDRAQVEGFLGPTYARLGAGLAIRAVLAFGSGLGAAGLALLVLALTGKLDPSAVWGVGLLCAGAVIAFDLGLRRETFYWRRGSRESYHEGGLITTATIRLEQIRFQQSVSSGWSSSLKFGSSLKLPIEVEAARSGGLTLAQVPLSYPEIVEMFRDFIRDIVQQQGPPGRVLIGIDELDKIESEDKARQFLNDIKAIFGIEHCYYLISVSEDAVASFERRGMPFRDVFDSSFDEIVRVRYLDTEAAKRLLFRRIVGWPLGFVGLCYCLSGGLARDLIRVARNLVDLSGGTAVSLGDVSLKLVKAELASKTESTTAAISRMDLEPDVGELLAWSEQLQIQSVSAKGLLTQCTAIEKLGIRKTMNESTSAAERRLLLRLASELVTFYYYSATIIEFFDQSLDKERLRRAELASTGAGSLDHLALSRQAFAVNPRVAWGRLSSFREAWELPVRSFPATPTA